MTLASDLLERVRAAAVPDHDLDIRLYCLATGDEYKPEQARESARGDIIATTWNVPAYTASVDAALALVERTAAGWRPDLHSPRMGRPWEAVLSNGAKRFVESGPTAPLAILGALLTTLIASAESSP